MVAAPYNTVKDFVKSLIIQKGWKGNMYVAWIHCKPQYSNINWDESGKALPYNSNFHKFGQFHCYHKISKMCWSTLSQIWIRQLVSGLEQLLYHGNGHVCSNRGYFMAVQAYEICLWVLKNISWVSAASKWNIFQQEKINFVSLNGHVMLYLL